MNDFDLEVSLKSVQLPERSEEYWNDFPARIRVQLRHTPSEIKPRSVWRPRLQWAGGFALALALMYVGERFHPLETASKAITKQERNFRAQAAKLEAGMHTLVFNAHGMGYLLAEAN
jgi:hypothetical protein